MKKTLLVIAYTLSTAAAYAGDVSTTEFLGFSPDGSAVGFQEYGTQDGSGFPYCKVTFVDTKKNKYIVSPASVVIQTEMESGGEEKACAKAKAKVKKTLAKLKLSTSKGSRNFVRLLSDEAGKGAMKVRFATYANTYESLSSVVTLTETPTGAKDDMGNDLKKMTVSLSTDSGKTVKVLQQDVSLPASRANATGYELEAGYSFQSAMNSVQVIVVRYYQTGFEGPDVRSLIVTGVRD